MSYPNYDERSEDCVRFVRSNWPKSVKRAVFNSEDRWYWQNLDGDFFLHETEEAACADYCLETGITEDELDKGSEA